MKTFLHFYTVLLSSVIALITGSELQAMPYFRHFTAENGLANPAVMSMCQDSLGRIWLGTEDGLSIYDGNGITTCRTGFKDGLIRKLVCDSRGDVYFLTATELVRHNTRTGHMDVLREAPFSALYIHD